MLLPKIRKGIAMQSASRTLSPQNTHGSKSYSFVVPNICPHCGKLVEAKTSLYSVGNDVFVAFLNCPEYGECRKAFFAVYLASADDSNSLQFMYMYPGPYQTELPEHIRNLSPRCVELYNQAKAAENLKHFDLAACGYRNAIEALVKDFAIKYKDAASDEKLLRKPLQNCINEYLDNLDEAVSAYMVKEFGNNATHYPQLEQFDFTEQMNYLDIFLSYMSNKIKTHDIAITLPQKHLQKFASPASQAD